MTSQLYLHPSENPNMLLVSSKFNGTNYGLWADAFSNGLAAKNKLGFIDGKVGKPPGDEGEDNIELVAWRQCNAMVRGWLRSSIKEKLYPSISFSGGVKEIWDELRGRYTAGNALRVHQLKGELGECKQKNESVTEYYTRLKVIWDELGNYSKVPPCTCGAAAALAKEREDERVHQFFMGLDDKKYGHLRTNILMEDPIISLNRAYGLVLREETHANMIKAKEETVEATMSVKTYGTGRGGAGMKGQRTEQEENIPHYTHGYEAVKARGRGRGRRGVNGGRGNYGHGGGRSGGRGTYQANVVGTSSNSNTTDTGSLPFNAEEIERIRIMLASSPEGNDKLTGLPDGRTVDATDHGEVVLIKNFILKDDRLTGTEIGRSGARKGVYYFRGGEKNEAHAVNISKESKLWHARLGHPSCNVLSQFSDLVGKKLYWNSDEVCDACCKAKQTRISFSPNNKRCLTMFGLLHCDIWGGYSTASFSQCHFFLTIGDDYGRHVWVQLIRDKGEAGDKLRTFLQMIKTQFNTCAKIVQSDNGT
ncbi:uncharacterized protein LOC141607611 [Silene latifolia]|uniref:uncharacterized protein LOC141607611 n=1 Tax=Silene latifolia TaxID=37657 RepID=UPI003D7897C5